MQKGRGNHHIKDQKNIWNVDDSIRSQKYKILKTPENLNAGKKNIFMHSHLRTATSFLNAWNCSGVGSVTFKIFTATSPTAKIIMKSTNPYDQQFCIHSAYCLFFLSGNSGKWYTWWCVASAAHSYHAIFLWIQFRRSRNQCGSADKPRWPQSPSSNWSHAYPEASE